MKEHFRKLNYNNLKKNPKDNFIVLKSQEWSDTNIRISTMDQEEQYPTFEWYQSVTLDRSWLSTYKLVPFSTV